MVRGSLAAPKDAFLIVEKSVLCKLSNFDRMCLRTSYRHILCIQHGIYKRTQQFLLLRGMQFDGTEFQKTNIEFNS